MSQTLVVKIGTSSLTQPDSGSLALATIASLVETLSHLRQQGNRIVLVSSGAVGVGCARMGISERPRTITLRQAVAAIGQGRLMRIYDDLFSSLQQPIAQVLLTRGDLVQRTSYLNVEQTFEELLNLGVIPIVNENDTVAVDELKFGDNDTLSALVASLVRADWLFLLTDVDRLYSADPRSHPDAQPISLISHLSQLKELQVGNRGTRWGTGGMVTKITAAEIAIGAGVRTVIMEGSKPENLNAILQGKPIGTQFEPMARPTRTRKHWIAHSLVPTGRLFLDEGAVNAIRYAGKSLLAAGIVAIDGEFACRDSVQLCDRAGQEIARGLVNYNSQELEKIKGRHSDEIAVILGRPGAETIVHRDNLTLVRD